MDNNTASKRLAKGTVVYMIGNLMSKAMQVLILPIITGALATSEYGYYDLIVTTINLITPIATLQIIEAMFRFMFDADEEEKVNVVTTVTGFLLCGIVCLAGSIFFAAKLFPVIQYPFLIFMNYFSAILFDYMQKLARCQQKNKQFATSGVINTSIMLLLQAITLIVFKMGVDGMLIANSVSYIIAAIYLQKSVRVDKWIRVKHFSKRRFKQYLRYSAPLVPNSIAWWLVASSDRYIISAFLGASFNGLYSIASKFSQLLTFAISVFQMAWQENAILEVDSESRDEFYSETFNTYMRLLLSGYLVVLPFIRIIFPYIIAESYQNGYLYNPILLLGAVFAAFSQFYGSSYSVFKKTSGAFYTSIIAAFINIGVGVSLIRYVGLFGPAIGTALAFFIQWIIRAYQMRNCFKVRIDKRVLTILSLLCLGSTIVYYQQNLIYHFVSFVCGLIVALLVNWHFVEFIFNKIFYRRGSK